MMIEDVIGYYTYRSLRNAPEPADDFNTVKFAEAELFLHIADDGAVTGQLEFPPEPAVEEKGVMDLTGTVTSWLPLQLHFIGKGRAGTDIADYEYEYDCAAAATWDSSSPPQRLALTGTLRRNKDHGPAKAGVTASFIAVKREFPDPKSIPGVQLIPEAISMLASRNHRLRHTVWHTLRGDWFGESMTDEDREYLRSLRWGLDDPPRDAAGNLDLGNGAGEDFLFMHRRMIGMMRDVYVAAGKSPLTGWKRIPGPISSQYVYGEVDDPQTPGQKTSRYDAPASGFLVPPATDVFLSQFPESQKATFHFIKSNRFFTVVMRNLDTWLRRRDILATLTLGAYGNLIEFTLHNWMHMRWASEPRDPVTGAFGVRDGYDVDPKWDAPSFDYLGDFHSSHVNPIFWKLHGWVDDRIQDWFRVQDSVRPGTVVKSGLRGVDWFKPDGLWVKKDSPFDWPEFGGGHGGHGGGHTGHGSPEDAELEVLLAVMDRLREVANRPPAPAPAGARVPLSALIARAMPRLAGFARTIAETGLEPG